MRVLIVEDEPRLARHIASALTESGHDHVRGGDGEGALRELSVNSFDLVVLDVGLPGRDGFDVLREMRQRRIATRVIMLTARGELNDRVLGLKLGADDYLAKPFAMQEFLARITALGRRFTEAPKLELRVGDLQFRLSDQEVTRRPADRSFHA